MILGGSALRRSIHSLRAALFDILTRTWWMPLALLYVTYLMFIVGRGQGAVDYETFIDIGQRWLDGDEVYVVNSHYPMPTVMIFGWLAWLPDGVAMLIWHAAPVVLALWITRNPLVLGFAPLFAHFLGGQTTIFGLLGYWGYRRHQGEGIGGAWLAVTLLKPQLGMIPILYALPGWRYKRRQACIFGLTATALYLPSFLFSPTWLLDWLGNARTLRPRAMAGFIPRVLITPTDGGLFWLGVLVLGGVLLGWLWRRGRLDLDSAVLWGFVVSPLLHDYDLIQLVPLLQGRRLLWAVVLSLPTWLVILAAYEVDAAWGVVTIIGAGLLIKANGTPTYRRKGEDYILLDNVDSTQ